MADQWYYTENRERRGPVSEEQLKELASSGQLKPTDKVWKKGMAAWEAASAAEGLIPKPAENEPPPVPTEAIAPTSSSPSFAADVPHSIPPHDFLSPPSPWIRAREFLTDILQSPLTVIGIALIVSAFLPFLLCLHFSVAGLLGLLQNGFVLLAAVLTLRKKHYGVAVLAALLVIFGWLWMPAGILKCVSAVIALPIGIWSILTLHKPESQQQFLNQNDPVAPATQWIVAKCGLQSTPQNAIRVALATMGGVYALAVILAVFVGHSSAGTSEHNDSGTGGHYAAAFAQQDVRAKGKYAELEKQQGKPWNEIAEARRAECNQAVEADFNERLKELPPPQLEVDASATPYVRDVTIKPPRYGSAGILGNYLVFPVSLTASRTLNEWKHGLFCRVLGPDGAALEDCGITLKVSAHPGDKVSAEFQVCRDLTTLTTVRLCYKPPKN